VLTSRYANAANSPATRTAMALMGDTPTGATLASTAPAIDNAAYLSSFPDVRSVTPVTTASASPSTAPVLRPLFQGNERTQPVSPAVQVLWGNSSSLTSVPSPTSVATVSATPAPPQTPDVRAPQPLDLFSDRSGTFSS
jgi:hypothetical protein